MLHGVQLLNPDTKKYLYPPLRMPVTSMPETEESLRNIINFVQEIVQISRIKKLDPELNSKELYNNLLVISKKYFKK
jgi:hypothetical protein